MLCSIIFVVDGDVPVCMSSDVPVCVVIVGVMLDDVTIDLVVMVVSGTVDSPRVPVRLSDRISPTVHKRHTVTCQ